MNKQVIIEIKMVPAGVELVLAALARLPYDQVAGLIAEIRGQAEYQLAPQQAEPETISQPEEGDPQ